jgi:hypothetical protein
MAAAAARLASVAAQNTEENWERLRDLAANTNGRSWVLFPISATATTAAGTRKEFTGPVFVWALGP